MLDIRFIRENLDIVKEAAQKKYIDIDLDRLMLLDDQRRALQKDIEEKKAKQNQVNDEIPTITDMGTKAARIEDMKSLKSSIQSLESELEPIVNEWREIMLCVPNIPDISAPVGPGEDENLEIKTWGEKTTFTFEPKDHIELMLKHDMVDFERGTKVHGFRGYFLKGDGAMLSWAIWNWANEFYLQRGFNPFIAPAIVRKNNIIGTGFATKDFDDIYITQDDDALAGTSEVPIMGYYANEILSYKDLPIKNLGFSPCFRREAGSYSKDVKGLIRVHEFFKHEQLILCEASHEESVMQHEWMQKNIEEFIESLEIPYRVVVNSTGDMGLSKVKMYDIELWIPKEEKYREIGSASYFHDFQTRRFNIRYKAQDGSIKYAHSLNATAIATPRILVSIVENFQQADGSIIIPLPLQKYMNKGKIG